MASVWQAARVAATTTTIFAEMSALAVATAVFSESRREKWECVRGMDKSFGYNRMSRPEDFLSYELGVKLHRPRLAFEPRMRPEKVERLVAEPELRFLVLEAEEDGDCRSPRRLGLEGRLVDRRG